MDTTHTDDVYVSPWRRALDRCALPLALIVAAFAFLAPALLAQEVRAWNYGSAIYGGWTRATIDRLPPHLAGVTLDGTQYVVGRQLGRLGYAVDLRVKLAPGTGATYRLAKSNPWDAPAADLPADGYGRPVIGGTKLVEAQTSVGGRANPLRDGAGVLTHWVGRPWLTAPLFHVDCWLLVYPGQPWAVGELVVTCSNPSVPEVVGTVPAGGCTVGWSDGLVLVDGLPLGAPLLAAGETFGSGQSRAYRLLVGWPQRATLSQVQSALVDSAYGLVTNGIQQPGLLGAVTAVPDTYSGVTWAAQRIAGVRAALHGWGVPFPGVGVNPRAGDTGAQEDQGFKGSEAYSKAGVGPEAVRVYAALGQLRRPCHHLEADGSPLVLAAHPGLNYWAARPHFDTGASPDRLGKPVVGWPGNAQFDGTWNDNWQHGWEGPDREHWLINTVGIAYQWTASCALQWELEHEARVLWFGETVDPRLLTSHADAARSGGWAGLVASWLYLGLEDRGLADQIAQRMRERVAQVYVPEWSRPASDVAKVWDARDDARLNDQAGGPYQLHWMAYQQAVGALGLQVLGEVLDLPAARQLAYEGALTVVEQAYTQDPDNGHWIEWDVLGYQPGGVPLPPSAYGYRKQADGSYVDLKAGAGHSGFFTAAWFPGAVWTVLRHNPKHERAQAIWAQMLATARTEPNDWLPPLTASRTLR